MIKKETTRATLGLTQQDTALLLKVSRSLYSLFELKRRNLPSKAGLMWNAMLAYMISPQGKALQNLPKMEKEEVELKRLLEKRIKENDYQLVMLVRKINKVQEKLENYKKSAQLISFLNSPEGVEKSVSPEAVKAVGSLVISNFRKSKSELDLLQIDHELLQLQQDYLQKTIRKFK